MDVVRERAALAGLDLDTLFKSRDASWIRQTLGEAEDRLTRSLAVAEKYGIALEQMGEKFRQSRVNEMARDVLQEFDDLLFLGVDVNIIIEKMGSAINDFVPSFSKSTAMRSSFAKNKSLRVLPILTEAN